MAALEVGIKRFISHVLPEADWLVTNLPAPPAPKLLAEYLPKLGTPDPVKLPEDDGLRVLWDGVGLRNRLAHAGKSTPAPDRLERLLREVRDVLWSLDAARGHTWASKHRGREETVGYKGA